MVIVDFQHALPVGHQLHTRGWPDFTRCRVMPAHSSSHSQPLAQNSSAALGAEELCPGQGAGGPAR